jgi:hypothetical protein
VPAPSSPLFFVLFPPPSPPLPHLFRTQISGCVQGTTQNRFYALAVVGELAFFNVQRSQLISSHAALRAGLVRVLRQGKGIEGEVCFCIYIVCVFVCVSASVRAFSCSRVL